MTEKGRGKRKKETEEEKALLQGEVDWREKAGRKRQNQTHALYFVVHRRVETH